jgi:[acyl-carrier-protein] S-malonyltransferase
MATVATVAGRPIPVSRLEERLAAMRREPRGRHLPPDGAPGASAVVGWVVQELVTEAVLLHEAAAHGGEGTTDGAAIARLVDRVTASVVIPQAEARAFYERNRDRYRHPESRRIRHFLFPDAPSAERLAGRLRSGEPGLPSGDLRETRRGELSGPLEDALFAAAPGEVVGPIRSGLGWHVARVEGIDAASVAPFAEVRAAIEEELLAAARLRAFGDWLAERRRVLAVIDPDYEHPGHPARGALGHRH